MLGTPSGTILSVIPKLPIPSMSMRNFPSASTSSLNSLPKRSVRIVSNNLTALNVTPSSSSKLNNAASMYNLLYNLPHRRQICFNSR